MTVYGNNQKFFKGDWDFAVGNKMKEEKKEGEDFDAYNDKDEDEDTDYNDDIKDEEDSDEENDEGEEE